MKHKLFKFSLAALILFVIGSAIIGQGRWNPIYNPKVEGWLFVDTNVGGQRTWGVTGTADTLVVAGIDSTNFRVLVTPVTNIENMRASIGTNGDTVFVTSDSAQTAATDKYNWLIFR